MVSQFLPSTRIERDEESFSKLEIVKDGASFKVFDENGKQICGATNRNGQPCRKLPSVGKNRCKLHGGHSLAGKDHPRYTNGRYIRSFVDRGLASRYEDMMQDETLVQLREEIALITVMIEDMVKDGKELTTTKTWQKIKRTFSDLKSALNRRDQEQVTIKLSELNTLINEGTSESERADTIFRAVEVRKNLVTAEHKRTSDRQNMMTADEAMTMLSFIVDIIREEVKDTETQQKIGRRIREYVVGRKKQ